jgi:hypothetical protein
MCIARQWEMPVIPSATIMAAARIVFTGNPSHIFPFDAEAAGGDSAWSTCGMEYGTR